MKKSTLEQIVALVNGNPVNDMDALRNEINAEWARLDAKAQSNRNLYATAHDVVMARLNDTPMMASELFAACAEELPEDFTVSKLQYALTRYWVDEVEKHDNGKNPFTYTKR